MTELMPNPLEGNPAEFVAGSDRRALTVDAHDGAGHFIGHVFKLNVDPYVGRLAALRVHQGEIHTGDQVFIGDKRKPVKVAHLYTMQGKELREVPAAVAGDFCAVAKIDELHFGDVLHSSHDEDELQLRAPELPSPMHRRRDRSEAARPGEEALRRAAQARGRRPELEDRVRPAS